MLGAVEGLAALDPQVRSTDPLDPGAHPDEAVGEIGHLGLARRALDQTFAAGQHRRHQSIMGRAHRDLGQRNPIAGKTARGPRVDIATVKLDLGAERLERGQVQIDRARADGAAAGQRHPRPAAAGHKRRQDPEARPHAGDHLVRRVGIDDLGRGEPEGLAVAARAGPAACRRWSHRRRDCRESGQAD